MAPLETTVSAPALEVSPEEPTTVYLPTVMKNYSSPPPSEAIIEPGAGGQLGSPDGAVLVTFSPQAVTETTRAQLEINMSPASPPTDLAVVVRAFSLQAWRLGSGEPVTRFQPEVTVITHTSPITDNGVWYEYIVTSTVYVTITYADAWVWGLDEGMLSLYTWDETSEQWVPLPTVVNVEANAVRVALEHMSDFVLMAPQSTTSAERVMLDPDHGGIDPGGWVRYPPEFDAVEKTYTLEVAQLLRQRLEDNCGITVGMVRTADVTVPHRDRPDIINGFDPNLAVTLAFNTAGLGVMWYGPGGTMGLVDFSKPDDIAFSTAINNRVAEHTGVSNHRGVRDARYWRGGLWVPTHVPAVLYDQAELMFLDNYHDRAVMDDPVGQGAIADALYNEIVIHLGLEGKCELQPPPSPEQIQKWRDLGYQNYLRYGGDPVSFSTGNHVVQVHLFRIPARGFDFDFTLTYNAQDGRDGSFGYGWSMPYDMRITLYRDDSVDVRHADGRTHHYTWNGSGYEAPVGVHDTLAQTANGWQLTTPDERVFNFEEMDRGQGRLTELHDRRGNTLSFGYNGGGEMTTVRDGAGRTVTLHYTNGHVTRINDFAGRRYTLVYTNGDLISITDANGGTRRFQYDARHRMTYEWDEEDYLYLQSIYDDRDRVVEQIDASGSHCYFSYDPINRVTIFTDNQGHREVYHWDELNRVTGERDGSGAQVNNEYDADYNLTSRTDANGNTTHYEYNGPGNVTLREDPLDQYSIYDSDVTHWAYNEHNNVISRTDALGNTWIYEYDMEGNLTCAIAPDGSEITAEYNEWGQPTRMVDANGHVTQYEYDQYGNRIRTIDHYGNVAESEYDAAGREVRYTDAYGHSVEFEYDGNDNIVRIWDPKHVLSTFEYDGNDLLIRSVDRRGGEQFYRYDEDLKLVAERDPEGNWTYYGYDELYRRIAMTDALGYVTRYEYDGTGQLIATTDPTGATTWYEYDDEGNQIAVVDALGNRTRKIYDASNRLKYQIDALGNTTEYCYDAEDRMIRTIGPRGEVTDYNYDSEGRLIAVKDPLGNVTEYEHDGVGNRLATIDPLGLRTDYEYDALNRVVAVMRPELPGGERPTTQYAYDAVGNPLVITSPRGFTATIEYDANDNRVLVINALGGQTTYIYDPEDTPVTVTDPNGNTVTTDYNLIGLPERTTDAMGHVTSMEYDAVYNQVQYINAMGQVETYTYGPMGRLLQKTDPLGNQVTQNTYDLLGRIVASTDANGNTTRYGYDPMGRMISVTDTLSGTTYYEYDEVSNLVAITDANGYATHFEYNFLNQLWREINPLDKTWEYSYDKAGRLIRRRDAMWRATYYNYDSNNRLTAVRYGTTPPTQPPITFTYDLEGNQLQMCDGLGCTDHTYDPLRRHVATTDWLSRTITRTYNAVGNLTGLTYPNGYQVTYAHNANSQMIAFTDPHGDTSTYEYNPLGQVIQIEHPNNTVATFSYDDAGRLTGIDHRKVGADQPQSAYTYMLDRIGNRVQVVEERAAFDGSGGNVILTHHYEYDALNRLVRAGTEFPASDTAYTFDPVGNRLRKGGTILVPDPSEPELPVVPRPQIITYTYNAANQMLTAGNTAFDYNDNGDRVRQTKVLTDGTVLSTDYTYNREDQLVGVTRSVSDGVSLTVTMVATYTYDGYGRRVLKEVTYPTDLALTQVITYLYNTLDIIGIQLVMNGTVIETHYYRTNCANCPQRGAIIEMERLSKPAIVSIGNRYWYQYDGLGSITGLTKEDGALVNPYLYDEYGRSLAGDVELQIFMYTAQDYDPEVKLYHFYSRHYDPIHGIWVQVDRYRGNMHQPLEQHKYNYVAGQPTGFIDYLGFKKCDFFDVKCKLRLDSILARCSFVLGGGILAGYPVASYLLAYYLTARGETQWLYPHFILSEAEVQSEVKSIRQQAMRSIEKYIPHYFYYQMPPNITDRLVEISGYNSDVNYSLGDFTIVSTYWGEIGLTYAKLFILYKGQDRYNFDEGRSFFGGLLTSEDFKMLEDNGLAAQFNVYTLPWLEIIDYTIIRIIIIIPGSGREKIETRIEDIKSSTQFRQRDK